MNCPRQLVQVIIEYLRNRKCFVELNDSISKVFNLEKGVPQGSCIGPIPFILYHCTLLQDITYATHKHLFAGDLAVIFTASPWWFRQEFNNNMHYFGQCILNQIENYENVWKQPINSSKTDWQWIYRRVVLPSLTLTINQQPVKRTTLFQYLDIYVDERLTFNKHYGKMLQKIHKNSPILKYRNRSKTSSFKARLLLNNVFILSYFQLLPSKKLKQPIGKSIDLYTIGGTLAMAKWNAYPLSNQLLQEHNAFYVDSLTNQ
jgi:hypothetical protein